MLFETKNEMERARAATPKPLKVLNYIYFFAFKSSAFVRLKRALSHKKILNRK